MSLLLQVDFYSDLQHNYRSVSNLDIGISVTDPDEGKVHPSDVSKQAPAWVKNYNIKV